MKPSDTLFHIFLLILIITIGIALTSCVNWTPVEYIDTPIKEPPVEKVVLEQRAIENFNSEFECFLGSSADDCADFTIVDDLLEPFCNTDLCT